MGSGAKSYMRKGFLIYEEMNKYFHHTVHIWGGRKSYKTLHPIPLNFLIIEETFIFFLSGSRFHFVKIIAPYIRSDFISWEILHDSLLGRTRSLVSNTGKHYSFKKLLLLQYCFAKDFTFSMFSWYIFRFLKTALITWRRFQVASEMDRMDILVLLDLIGNRQGQSTLYKKSDLCVPRNETV